MSGRHQFSTETRERAVRLFKHRIDGDERTERQRLEAVAEKVGATRETVRRWVIEAEVEAGERPGAPSAAEVAELRRRNAELEATVAILKAATSFFARECDPRPSGSSPSSSSTGTSSESHRFVER